MNTDELIEHFRYFTWEASLPDQRTPKQYVDLQKFHADREREIMLISSSEDRASARADLRVLTDRVNESILTLADDMKKLLEECGQKVDGEVLGMPDLKTT